MPVPDELVQAAAAEALCFGHGQPPCSRCRHRAEAAIQAAFAKLPECRAAKDAIASRVAWRDHDHALRPCCSEAIIVALAREFGGRE